MKHITFLLVITSLMITVGCKKGFEKYQKNPNAPSVVPPSLILPKLIQDIFYQANPHALMYPQQYMVLWLNDDDTQLYNWGRVSGSEYNNLRETEKLIAEAKGANNNYLALAKFFRAYTFITLSMQVGNIPYSEAGMASQGIYAPKYDSQEEVFSGCLKELDDANEMLDNSNGELRGDILFEGDILKWKKLINSYKLRVLMNLSLKTGNASLRVKEQFSNIYNNRSKYPIIENNNENAALSFIDQPGNRYPTYGFNFLITETRMCSTFTSLLKNSMDPRLFKMADPIEGKQEGSFGSYDGIPANLAVTVMKGYEKSTSHINSRYIKDPVNEPYLIIGYADLELIIAEAAFRGWINADPATHYYNGITASCQFYGISTNEITDLLNNDDIIFDRNKALKQINTQRYIAYFMNSKYESYYNWRRTRIKGFDAQSDSNVPLGYPAYAIGPANKDQGRIPFRWMYSQNEIDNNTVNVQEAIKQQYGEDDINKIMWILIPE